MTTVYSLVGREIILNLTCPHVLDIQVITNFLYVFFRL